MNPPSLPKLSVSLVAVAALAAGGYASWHAWRGEPALEIRYRTVLVDRGPIESAVTATGTVNAVLTVQVGSQVAGRITAVHADFNNEVRRGQTLARIEPEPFELRVAQAEADVAAARGAVGVAQHAVGAMHAEIARARVASLEARRDAERKRALAERGFIVDAEAERADAAQREAVEHIRAAEAQLALLESQVINARAVLGQREAALAQAQLDLARTSVRAPVDGVVISRTAEVGLAVPPGFGAAPLFTIARDLREMQVDVVVSEADVGRLRVGQAAAFTVDAFPRRTFEGRVVQLRKAPVVRGDPATYTAVVSAPNADLALLPGMNARVRIVVEARNDVLRVPNPALAVRADDGFSGSETPTAVLWRIEGSRQRLRAVEVKVGLTDGTYTEILGGVIEKGDVLTIGAIAPVRPQRRPAPAEARSLNAASTPPNAGSHRDPQ